MSSYITFRSQLSGRCKDSRKVGNNTYIVDRTWRTWNEDGTITLTPAVALRYHATDIITFTEDGRIILKNNGWSTQTTAQRFHRYMPDGFNLCGWTVYKGTTPWYDKTAIGVDFHDGMDLSQWDKLVADQLVINRQRAEAHAEEVKLNRAAGAKRAALTRWMRKTYPWAEDYADELTDNVRQFLLDNGVGQWIVDRCGTSPYSLMQQVGFCKGKMLTEQEKAAQEKAEAEAEAEADAAFEAEERRIMEEADRINRLRYQAHLAAFNTGVTQ